MRLGMALATTIFLAAPVAAQEISEAVDKAMWCSSAVTLLDTLGVYPPEAVDAVALARLWSRSAFQALDAAGFTDEEVDMLIQSYGDEVAMQLPDYLVSSDETAMRLDLNACFDP